MAVKLSVLVFVAIINGPLITSQKSHSVTFEATSVTKKALLFEKEQTVFNCSHDENETINILQNTGEQSADQLIVNNSAVMTEFTSLYDLQRFNSTCTSLIMLQPQKYFSGYELECIRRTSLKHSSIVISVIDYPNCNFSLPVPIFFNNQHSRMLHIQLITTNKAVIKGMKNLQNHNFLNTTKKVNETHIMADFLSDISNISNNTTFFFEISVINDSTGEVRRVCSYGPIQFFDSLEARVVNTDDLVQHVYEEGDIVNLTCESNVKEAIKRLTALHIPKEVNFTSKNYSIGDSLHIEILNIECTSSSSLNILAQCQVTFQGEETQSEIKVNVAVVSCTRSWLVYVIIAIVSVFVITLIVFIYFMRRKVSEIFAIFTTLKKKYLGTKQRIKTQNNEYVAVQLASK